MLCIPSSLMTLSKPVYLKIMLLSRGAKTLAVTCSRVVCVIRATWHTHVSPENFFRTRGGGGLAPESPTGN